MKKILVLVSLFALSKVSLAQKMTPEEYVAKYKDYAIREMKRMGVPAAITLAQGLLETESGNSDLVKNSNNHFGIKCKATWTAEGYNHDDDAPGECFRVYKDAEASYRDHSNFLRGSDRYAFLFHYNPADYKSWAYGLRKAGYATNQKYPQILIKNIEQYNLQQYSLLALKDVPKVEEGKYADDPYEKFEFDSTEIDSPKVTAPAGASGKINGSRYIMATKGTSLLAIATNNNINLAKLLEFNDMDEDGILTDDQVIFLERKAKMSSTVFCIAGEGESLHDLSQKHGVQLESLLEYNSMTEDAVLTAGRKIYLKPAANTQTVAVVAKPAVKDAMQPAIVMPAPSANAKMHEVQPKEGLYSIAKKYGVTMQQLRDWNNLETDDLKIGQQLIVSN